jgi:hypothetical protein
MLVCAIGGRWWALFQEPRWLQQAANLTLTAWPMDGLTDLILRERGLADVLPAVGVLFAYGAGCLLLGPRLRRFSDRNGNIRQGDEGPYSGRKWVMSRMLPSRWSTGFRTASTAMPM